MIADTLPAFLKARERVDMALDSRSKLVAQRDEILAKLAVVQQEVTDAQAAFVAAKAALRADL